MVQLLGINSNEMRASAKETFRIPIDTVTKGTKFRALYESENVWIFLESQCVGNTDTGNTIMTDF